MNQTPSSGNPVVMAWNRLHIALVALAGCGPAAPSDPVEGSETSSSTTTPEPSTTSPAPTTDPTPDESTGSIPDPSSSSTGTEPEPEPWPDGEGPPTQGWFVFAGKPVGEPGGFDCLYRWQPDRAPTQLWCGADEPEVRLRHVLPPKPDSAILFTSTEELALDIYPEALWRIDASTGDMQQIAEWDGDPNGGTALHVERMFAVDDSCVAVQLRRQPIDSPWIDDLHIACVDEGLGDPLFPTASTIELRGVLDDGRLLAQLELGTLVLIDPTDGTSTTISTTPPSAFAHDGQRIAFTVGLDLQNEVRLWDDRNIATAGNLIHVSPSLGFHPDGHVLVGAGEVSRWAGIDAENVTALLDSPNALGYGDFLRVGDYTGMHVSEFDLTFGIAFASDSHVSPVCGEEQHGRILARVHATDEVLLVHTETDPRSPSRFHIFSCRPGGEPVDLLDGYDLVGTTLPAGPDAILAGYDA